MNQDIWDQLNDLHWRDESLWCPQCGECSQPWPCLTRQLLDRL